MNCCPSTVFSDLAPCDLFLFPNLKKSLSGQKFESSEEVIATTKAYFADLEKTYFSDVLKKLEHGWVKCIELKETILRNKSPLFQNFCIFIL
jgi:hypothetical protein